MSKFTPGPWIAENRPGSGREIKASIPQLKNYRDSDGGTKIWTVPDNVVISATNKPQPLIGYEPWVQFPPKWWIEMTKANADLISAAPDMYEALMMAISYLGNSDTWEDGEHILFHYISRSLTKADGGTPDE